MTFSVKNYSTAAFRWSVVRAWIEVGFETPPIDPKLLTSTVPSASHFNITLSQKVSPYTKIARLKRGSLFHSISVTTHFFHTVELSTFLVKTNRTHLVTKRHI